MIPMPITDINLVAETHPNLRYYPHHPIKHKFFEIDITLSISVC